MTARHLTLPFLFALVMAGACSRTPLPEPALPPAANAPLQPERATLDGLQLEARLIDVQSLPAPMAARHGIAQAENRWMLLLTIRDAAGNGVPADAVQLEARHGDLLTPVRPLALRPIAVGGMNDWIGTLDAKPPATVNIEIDARHGAASMRMRFSRDLMPH